MSLHESPSFSRSINGQLDSFEYRETNEPLFSSKARVRVFVSSLIIIKASFLLKS
jgi:hypothetical protein